MKNLKNISKEREGRINLAKYKNLIETVSKVEYKRFSNLGLIDLAEVENLSNYTVYYIINTTSNKDMHNEVYLVKAMKWAIRNEIRRRYKWNSMKNSDTAEQEQVKEAVYKTILSIEEMADGETPTLIKDPSRNPEETTEIVELKKRINEIISKLPDREKELIEAKYVYDKKLKDIAVEFNISQSRISRIIQNALKKIKKELLKQERMNENNI